MFPNHLSIKKIGKEIRFLLVCLRSHMQKFEKFIIIHNSRFHIMLHINYYIVHFTINMIHE